MRIGLRDKRRRTTLKGERFRIYYLVYVYVRVELYKPGKGGQGGRAGERESSKRVYVCARCRQGWSSSAALKLTETAQKVVGVVVDAAELVVGELGARPRGLGLLPSQDHVDVRVVKHEDGGEVYVVHDLRNGSIWRESSAVAVRVAVAAGRDSYANGRVVPEQFKGGWGGGLVRNRARTCRKRQERERTLLPRRKCTTACWARRAQG